MLIYLLKNWSKRNFNLFYSSALLTFFQYFLLLNRKKKIWAFHVALVVKKKKKNPVSAGDLRDTSLILGLGRYPGEGNDNPFQYSCLKNAMDRGAWQATVHGITQRAPNYKLFYEYKLMSILSPYFY